MSTTSVDITMVAQRDSGPDPGLPSRARIYFVIVAVAAAAARLRLEVGTTRNNPRKDPAGVASSRELQ